MKLQNAWLCGPPSRVIEALREFERRSPGLAQVMIPWAEGMGPKEFREPRTRLAREGMPAFHPRR